MGRKRTAAQAAASEDTPVESTEPTVTENTSEQAPNPADPIVQGVADSTRLPDDATDFDPAKLEGEAIEQPAPVRQQGKPMASLGRGWVERYQQPVKYAQSTFKDAMGKEHIAFRFDLPPGQTKPDEAIIEVMRDHKYFKDGGPNGLSPDAKDDPESYPTGLHFENLPRGGKAWLLPNTQMGRTVADSINQALDGLAKRMEGGVGGPG